MGRPDRRRAGFDPPSDLEPAAVFSLSDEGNAHIAFSSDSKHMAVATGSGFGDHGPTPGTIRIWNIATSKLKFEQPIGHDGRGDPIGALSVSFHPNNKWVAVACGDLGQPNSHVTVWDFEQHQKIKEVDGEACLFSPDGKLLACVDATEVRLLKTQNWEFAHQLLQPKGVKGNMRGGVFPSLVGFSTNSERIFVVTLAEAIDVYDVGTGTIVTTVESKDLKTDDDAIDIQSRDAYAKWHGSGDQDATIGNHLRSCYACHHTTAEIRRRWANLFLNRRREIGLSGSECLEVGRPRWWGSDVPASETGPVF